MQSVKGQGSKICLFLPITLCL